MLPNFIVIGSAKAGTTSLYEYLGQHPDVFMSAIKETNYFAVDDELIKKERPTFPFPVKTVEEYEALFATVTTETAIGEASPIYFESPIAAQSIYSKIPEAKLILSLRNPVQRAFSGYLMHIRYGKNVGPVSVESFGAEQRYVQAGLYSDRVEQYLKQFGQSQLKILMFEDLVKSTSSVLKDVFQFLEVSDDFEAELTKKHNVGSYPKYKFLNQILMNDTLRNKFADYLPVSVKQFAKNLLKKNVTDKPILTDEVIDSLQRYYQDDINRLENLIDKDLSSWKG